MLSCLEHSRLHIVSFLSRWFFFLSLVRFSFNLCFVYFVIFLLVAVSLVVNTSACKGLNL